MGATRLCFPRAAGRAAGSEARRVGGRKRESAWYCCGAPSPRTG